MAAKKTQSLTKEALLAGRRFEELSDAEKRAYGESLKRDPRDWAQEIVDNLNKHTATKRHGPD